eukprot:m51a1_g6675 hypothetical protein (265) ;mRNA; r:210064-210906
MKTRKKAVGIMQRDKPHLRQVQKKRRQVIREYHVINKQIAAAEADATLDAAAKALKIAELKHKAEEAGGLELYQQASMRATAVTHKFRSSKWVLKTLHELGVRAPLTLLDVGSHHNDYEHSQGIRATCIDINPPDSTVTKADLLDLVPPPRYDVVVASLVINFEGDPAKRGQMLLRARDLAQEDGGIVIVVLPRACFDNSRYMTHGLFEEMCAKLGLSVVQTSSSPKLAFYVLRRVPGGTDAAGEFPKRLIRTGTKRNNFSIVL